MSNNNTNGVNIGCGVSTLAALLGTAFIVLKLCGVINWSWLWVLSPLWISFSLSALLGLFILMVSFILLLHK